MAVLKYSKQREAIRDFLAHSEEHPTADMVYMNLRESFPNISLGTVYRNLSLLSETGQILKLNMRDSADRFDGRITPSQHKKNLMAKSEVTRLLFTESAKNV